MACFLPFETATTAAEEEAALPVPSLNEVASRKSTDTQPTFQ
jgi:hypothetical protein